MKRRNGGPSIYSLETTIEIGDEEVDVTVRYTYSPGTPDTRDEPGDGAECEIQGIFRSDDVKGSKCIMDSLPTATIEDLFEQASEAGPEALDDGYQRAMEDKADRQREDR